MKHLTLVHYMVRSASYQKNEGGKCRCSAKGHTQPTLPTFFCSECAGRTLSEGHLRSEQVGGDHLPRNLENEQRRRNRRDAAARQTQQSFNVVSTRDRTAIRGSMCQCLRIGSTLTANAKQGTASPDGQRGQAGGLSTGPLSLGMKANTAVAELAAVIGLGNSAENIMENALAGMLAARRTFPSGHPIPRWCSACQRVLGTGEEPRCCCLRKRWTRAAVRDAVPHEPREEEGPNLIDVRLQPDAPVAGHGPK